MYRARKIPTADQAMTVTVGIIMAKKDSPTFNAAPPSITGANPIEIPTSAFTA